MKRWLVVAGIVLAGCGAFDAVDAQRNVRLPAQQRTTAEQEAHQRLLVELSRLRQAAELESAGNPLGAERIIAEVLAANPGSLTAVLAMERVLHAQGRLAEVLPVIDTLLVLDPGSVIAHQARLRVANRLNDVTLLERAVSEWIRRSPTVETPYREAAQIWRQRGDADRAIRVLEEGRKRVDMPDALALELGDAFAQAGRPDRAAAEWSRAIGTDGRGFMLVQRRLQEQPDGGAAVIPVLVKQLGAPGATTDQQRVGALLAVDAGLQEEALRLARAVVLVAPAEDRPALLVEIARRADAAESWQVAQWAWSERLAVSRDPSRELGIRSRLAQLALLAGDTVAAAAEYRLLEQAAATGSPQRRQAVALRIQLDARDGLDAARAARAELDAFHREYPRAPEYDATAAAVAEALLDGGDADAAEAVLRSVSGPRSAQLSARVALLRGDAPAARNALLFAAPQLSGRAATETIALAGLLSRVSAPAAELVARVVAAPDEERADTLRSVARAATALQPRDRAALLDFLAGAADRSGLHEDAAALRRTLVETAPTATETAAALLALARGTDDAAEARLLLEKLIIDHPQSPLAPQARTELQRLPARAQSP